MSWLTLSPGRKVKVGVTFEHPDDEQVAMAGSDEALAVAAQAVGSRDHEALDREMGMRSVAMAQVTVMSRQSSDDACVGVDDMVLFMTKDELRRHVCECKAVLRSMDGFEQSADTVMAGYRRKVQGGTRDERQGEEER